MKQVLYIFTVFVLTTSCATMMNERHTNLTIFTTAPSEIIFKGDTVKTVGNKAKFRVERNKKPIRFIATTDSLTKTFQVKSQNSCNYWANICCNYGIGMLIDRQNPKRYAYPQRIYLNSTDTIGRYFRYDQANKTGGLYLHLSLPHINSFCLAPKNEDIKLNTGFWGLTLGLDYYHKKNEFINLGVSAVSDFFMPFPAAVDLIGEYELMSSGYISLSNNYKLRRFTIGYGLSFARNIWDRRYYYDYDSPEPTRESVKKSSTAFGLIFPTYFVIGKHFNVGVVYRPTFYRPYERDKFRYEHSISIDFAWKIRLKK